MGLVKSKELDTGIVMPEAYTNLAMINCDISRRLVIIVTSTYKDYEARLQGKPPVCQEEYRIEPENYEDFMSSEILSQAEINQAVQVYNFLKTLTVFEGSIDIL